MGRDHEDLLLVTGRLENAISFNCVVDWLSPTKVRQHARPRRARDARRRHAHRRPDLLRERRRGVGVGRHAVAARRLRGRRDALRAGPPRAAAGRARGVLRPALRRSPTRRCVTLAEGLETVLVAEAVLASARGGATETVKVTHLRAVVVALGKIGLPLAAQIARAGHEVVGCDIDAATSSSSSTRRSRRSRASRGSTRRWRRSSATGACAPRPTRPRPSPTGADLVVAVPPLVVDADAQPDWRALDAVRRRRRRAGCGAGRPSAVETTVPVGTTRSRVAPALARRSGLRVEDEFFCVFSPERVYSGRVFRDLATYPKLVGGLSAAGEARGGRALPQLPGRPRCGRWARPRRPS